MPHTDRLTSSPIIRHGTRREIPDIESVILAAYAEFRHNVSPAFFDAYMSDARHLAERWDEAEVIVAEVEGRIAGTVAFYADASSEGLGLPQGWTGFRRLGVHPAVRGHGTGFKLAQWCVDASRTIKAPSVGIHTASFMTTACAMYERMGFRRAPEHDLRASEVVHEEGGADITAIAYRLDLT